MKFLPSVHHIATASLVGLCLWSAGCTKKAETPAALAQVGSHVITVADFKAEWERRQANRQPLPDRQTLLEQMITRETCLQQARALGLDQTPEVRRACEDLLLARFKEQQLAPKIAAVKVLPEEIAAAYAKEKARFTQPAKVQLAFVFIAAESKASTNALAELSARAAEARRLALGLPTATRGFGKVAADFSDDQLTRYRGGDGGWFVAGESLLGRWPATVITAGWALKNAGDLSEVIAEKNGFYLVRKIDARPEMVTPLAQVQPVLERQLQQEKCLQAEQDFQKQLQASLKVQRDAALLAGVAYPNPNTNPASSSVPPSLPSAP